MGKYAIAVSLLLVLSISRGVDASALPSSHVDETIANIVQGKVGNENFILQMDPVLQDVRDTIGTNEQGRGEEDQDRSLRGGSGYFKHYKKPPVVDCPFGGKIQVERVGPQGERCIGIGEGICSNGWAFFIHKDHSTLDKPYLMLWNEHESYPVFQWFPGVYELCIGERYKNNAYLTISVNGHEEDHTVDGTYYLVGHDAGRHDKLPSLKIVPDAPKPRGRALGSSNGDVVEFRDGSGDENALWTIRADGESIVSPDAEWYFRCDPYEEYFFLTEFEISEYCEDPPFVQTEAIIEEVFTTYFNEEIKCNTTEKEKIVCGGPDEVILDVDLYEFEIGTECNRRRTQDLAGDRWLQARKTGGKLRTRSQARRNCSRKKQFEKKKADGSPSYLEHGGSYFSVNSPDNNRNLQTHADETCPADLLKIFQESDQRFEDLTEARITGTSELDCSHDGPSCINPDGLCCGFVKGCTCPAPAVNPTVAPPTGPTRAPSPTVAPPPTPTPDGPPVTAPTPRPPTQCRADGDLCSRDSQCCGGCCSFNGLSSRCALFSTFCSDGTIYDIVSTTPIYSTLTFALDQANLDTALSSQGPLTLFAPINTAFAKLPESERARLLSPVFDEHLTDLLLFHVLDDLVTSSDLRDGLTVTAINGEDLTVRLPAGNNPRLFYDSDNFSEILVSEGLEDQFARNGVFHGIDDVLLPRSVRFNILELADTMEECLIFVKVVKAVGLDVALTTTSPITVFAPSNAAFGDLLSSLDLTLEEFLCEDEEEEDFFLCDSSLEPLVKRTLLYHVVKGNEYKSLLSDGQELTTLTLDSATVEISIEEDGDIFVNESKVIKTDLLANNGVKHVIDKVLSPPTDCKVQKTPCSRNSDCCSECCNNFLDEFVCLDPFECPDPVP